VVLIRRNSLLGVSFTNWRSKIWKCFNFCATRQQYPPPLEY